MSETILVTGGAGYIGSHVVHALLDDGRRPVVVDDLSTGHRDFVPADVPFLRANVADGARVRAFMGGQGCRSVVHLAGSVNVEESTRDPLGYYENNVCASRALIESCVAEGIEAFIFSSSAAVYGNPEREVVSETDPVQPVSPYGWSKLMTERMLADACEAHSMRAVSLRYFNVAGADPKGRCGLAAENATHLIKVLCEAAVGVRPDFTVFGDDYDTPDGTCIRDFIHVSDLAGLHVAALDYLLDGHPGDTFNCGYGHGFSVRQVIDVLQRLSDAPIAVRTGPRRAGDIVALVADTRKLHASIDFHPAYDNLDEIVASALDWERRLLDRARS